MSKPLPPIPDQDWPETIADMQTGFAGALNIYRVMAHNPLLLRAWTTLREHVTGGNSLSEQQREMVILRTGHRWGSRYEWAHHVARGLKVGLSPEQIATAAREMLDGPSIKDEDVALLHATDALLADGRITPDLQDQLAMFLSQSAFLDLMATIGMYTTLAFIANTFDVPIDADVSDSH